MMYGYYGDWTGRSMMGGFFMVIFWFIIIFCLFWIIKNASQIHHSQYKEKNVLEILKERYAKGEIDQKEFETIKKNLKD